MEKYIISEASYEDEEVLADIFMDHIRSDKEYISHGEIQMGVAIMSEGGPEPSSDARKMWMKYIDSHIKPADGNASVFKIADKKNIAGFCVVDIEEDGAEPFGMVCDVLVREDFRSLGLGSRLLEQALSWFSSKGIKDIYLESGKDNHAAHAFFRKRGFRHISEIFKLC
ncbi:MAG: GNAT family N-acetyltransferase [Bacteroidales bacterium]|jgi:ribosomal protein S18 acetylase RimI-like enzyme|nr:GNAT family N-acetyltransferase [Bacteroidales bacterium]MCI1785520.1 GNAT family N-acetyltransferase [Bacteroidales bacterium]